MPRLEGRRALVTGAAGGIGEAIARQFAAEGARLVLLDRDIDRVEAVAASIDASAHVCDVVDPVSVVAAVGEATSALGGLDIVVNAAGVLVREPFESLKVDVWDQVFAINLRGPMLVIQAALPALKASTDAAIVNIASMNAHKPSPGTSAYAASKAGLVMLSKSLALDLAPIRVNAVCPGIVETAMTAGFMADPETRARICAANALRTVGRPDDIAAAVVFLASADARFMTGAQMVIDGGSSYA